MDLKNGRITIGELLSNPKVREYVKLNMVRDMPLHQAVGYARGRVPQAKINEIINTLQNI